MSTKAVDLAIRITGDASDVEAAFDDAGAAALRMGDDVERATSTADAATDRMSSVADSADNVGSKSSQAAGGLGDLGGALAGLPGPLGAVGAGMEAAAAPVMGLVGAADLLNLATSSTIVTQARARVSALATAATSKVVAAATRVWAATQWALNAALTANPVGLVVLAVVALVAIIVLAYKKSETFRTVVQGVMKVVGAYVGTVVKIVETLVDFVGDKAPAAWRALKEAAVNAAEWIADKVGGAFDKAIAPVQWLIDHVKDLLDLISDIKIPGTGSEAAGTVSGDSYTPRPTLPGTLSSGRAAPSIDNSVTVNVDGSGIVDEAAVARALAPVLDRHALRMGRTGTTAGVFA